METEWIILDMSNGCWCWRQSGLLIVTLSAFAKFPSPILPSPGWQCLCLSILPLFYVFWVFLFHFWNSYHFWFFSALTLFLIILVPTRSFTSNWDSYFFSFSSLSSMRLIYFLIQHFDMWSLSDRAVVDSLPPNSALGTPIKFSPHLIFFSV